MERNKLGVLLFDSRIKELPNGNFKNYIVKSYNKSRIIYRRRLNYKLFGISVIKRLK